MALVEYACDMRRDLENAELLTTMDEDDVPENFIRVSGGGIIPNDLAELYNFHKRLQAPKAWQKGVANNEELGSIAKAQFANFMVPSKKNTKIE